MKLHWNHFYELPLEGDKSTYEVRIYRFSPKALFLIAPEPFYTAFGTKLNDVGGSWNSGLKLDDGVVYSGWLFDVEDETQGKLFGLMKNIHSGIVKPEKPFTVDCDSLYSDILAILGKIPTRKVFQTKKVLGSTGFPEGEMIFCFNRDQEEPVKGDCVLTIEKSKKKLEIFQYRYPVS